MVRIAFAAFTTLTLALGATTPAHAQAWPAKPVRILVSSGPIGPSDVAQPSLATSGSCSMRVATNRPSSATVRPSRSVCQ